MGPVDVVIVGSGPAGLGVAGELKRRGLEAVVLERAEAIAARWRSRYAGLRLNTFRAYSHLPGSPLPREAGRYASLETFVAYLEDYARSRSLDVRPGVEAQRVERDRAGGRRVISSGGELSCRNVVVAAGWGAEPNLPGWVNNAAFATRLLHTSQLSDPAEFTGSVSWSSGPATAESISQGCSSGPGRKSSSRCAPRRTSFPETGSGSRWGRPCCLQSTSQRGPSTSSVGSSSGRWYGDLSQYRLPRAPVGFMTRFRRAGTNPAVDDGFISALKLCHARVVEAAYPRRSSAHRRRRGSR